MNTVLEVLDAMDQKFSAPETWTQKAYARNSMGDPVFEFSETATCWCVSGCLMALTETSHAGGLNQVGEDVRSVLVKQLPGYTIASWNDKSERTFQDVKDLLVRAKASLQEVLATS